MPVRYIHRYDGVLWGGGTDYWTALEMGQVPAPEQRAMELLMTVCDEERVGIYCHTGGLPAMGNVTGNHYLINRRFGVDQIEDGRVCANYCIAIKDPAVPKTDSVIALMNMIEGEEMSFLATANRFTRRWGAQRPRGYNEYLTPFLSKNEGEYLKTILRRASHKDLDSPHPIQADTARACPAVQRFQSRDEYPYGTF